MLGHHFMTILRNVFRNRSSWVTNVAGLTIGMACCLLVSLWVIGEYSYDNFHTNDQNIYRVFTVGTERNNPATPAPLAPELKERFPEVVAATRYEPFSVSLVAFGDKRFYEENIVAADPDFFEIFSLPLLSGNSETALENSRSIVLTKSVAEKYFGAEDPLGKALTLDRDRLFTVTGVMADVPANSSLQFDIIVPFEYRVQLAKEITGWDMNWGWFSPSTYTRLDQNARVGELGARMSSFFAERLDDEKSGLSLMPLKDQYFYQSGTKSYTHVFSTIALLIIMMACINFINLATARAAQRAKEIGIRKVAGASRNNLSALLLGESVAVALLSLIAAVALVESATPFLSSITGASFTVDMFSLSYFLPCAVVFAVMIGLIAGAYPAFYLSSLRPVNAFKGNLRSGEKGPTLRRLLVVVQMCCSVLLIVGTAVIFKQFNYMKNKDIGYEKQAVINIPLRGECRSLYPRLKQEMLRDDVVAGVGGSAAPFPYWRWTTGLVGWDGRNPDDESQVCMNFIDVGLTEALDMEIVEGRSFSDEYPSDASTNFLINEQMVQLMGGGSVVGDRLTYGDSVGMVIGVMKDFHFEPLEGPIRPLVLALVPEQTGYMVVRFHRGDISGSLASVEKIWQRLAPGFPFDYYFIGDVFDQRFGRVQQLGNISGILTIVAILIACLGLYGLASFIAEQRTREIGIRKVLGASIASVVGLLSKEHLLLTIVANLVAWPLAYWAMNSWLENFAYHVDITAHEFIVACALVVGIVLVSVSSQALRTAMSNPVDSLRSE